MKKGNELALTDAEKLKNTAVELQILRDDLQGKLDEFKKRSESLETPQEAKILGGCLESGYKIAAKYAISRIDKILEG